MRDRLRNAAARAEFGRCGEPQTALCHVKQRFLTQPVVAERAQLSVRVAGHRLGGHFGAEAFEVADLCRVIAEGFQLAAVVEGKRQNFGQLTLAGGRPVQLVQGLVFAQPEMIRTMGDEGLHFFFRRVGGRTGVAGYGESPTSISVAAGRVPVLPAQVAAQQTAHEGVARAQHVEDLDREAVDHQPLLEAFGNGALDDHAALCAELDHEGRLRHGRMARRASRISVEPRQLDFFFGADDHVHMAQHFLQVAGHGLAGDKAGLAIALVGQPPEQVGSPDR